MRLVHFSKDPLGEVYSCEQDGQWSLKPRGLWVSDEDCEDSWSAWCRGEEFNLENFEYAHEVVLAEDANVLTISTAMEIDEFTQRYRKPTSVHDYYGMDWARVAADYQGMLITPYVWSRRLATNSGWYYAWDCASGCIWDASAIASVEAIEWARP